MKLFFERNRQSFAHVCFVMTIVLLIGTIVSYTVYGFQTHLMIVVFIAMASFFFGKYHYNRFMTSM